METHYEGDLLQWRHIAMETHNDVESKRFKDNNPHLFSHRRQPTLVTHTLFKDFEDKLVFNTFHFCVFLFSQFNG